MEKIRIITGFPYRAETATNEWIAENTQFTIIKIMTTPWEGNDLAVTIHYKTN